jgi:hypothetical protein
MLKTKKERPMSQEEQVLAVTDSLNRHDFDALLGAFEEEAVLDLPEGIRVIGACVLPGHTGGLCPAP